MTMTHDHSLIRLLDEWVNKERKKVNILSVKSRHPVWSEYVVLLSADNPYVVLPSLASLTEYVEEKNKNNSLPQTIEQRSILI